MAKGFKARPSNKANSPLPVLFMKDDWVRLSNQLAAKIVAVFQHRSTPEVVQHKMGTQLLVVTNKYPKAVFVKFSDVYNKLEPCEVQSGESLSEEEQTSKLVAFAEEHIRTEGTEETGTILVLQDTQRLTWNAVG